MSVFHPCNPMGLDQLTDGNHYADAARAMAESLFKAPVKAADALSEVKAARIAEAAKTARLRALRLAREAAEAAAKPDHPKR